MAQRTPGSSARAHPERPTKTTPPSNLFPFAPHLQKSVSMHRFACPPLPKTLRRCVVTGSSGYLGSRLVAAFQQAGVAVLGIDQRPASGRLAAAAKPASFVASDIRASGLADAIGQFSPDTIIHAAFAVQPLRDDGLMQAVNVGGTTNILQISAAVKPERLLVVSSATAYGAWADNPIPMDETFPRRPCQAFRYAADKQTVEGLLDAFSLQHPGIDVSWVRPGIIGGPCGSSFVTRFILHAPVLARFDGVDQPLQFVHEWDVVRGIAAVLSGGGRGAYNLAPPNWTLVSEIARETGRTAISMPFWLGKAIHSAGWHLRTRLHEAPAGFLAFARNPWVVAPRRLTEELDFRFAYSSLDTLRSMLT
jgi:UDP-glucose 4-epimerase